MSGYTARHVIVRNNDVCDAEPLSASECDGWYIDPPAAWLELHSYRPHLRWARIAKFPL
ncbi:MAG TPA: hypothetical protein VK604_25145 [Bryobacteraceae bacterium]|nr:hypothetical protein [Bryobacteraceae bacterium]